MGLEQQRGFVARFLPGLLRQFAQLLNGLCLGILEPGPFRVRVRHFVTGDRSLRPLVEIQRSDGDAVGNAFALNQDHFYALRFR